MAHDESFDESLRRRSDFSKLLFGFYRKRRGIFVVVMLFMANKKTISTNQIITKVIKLENETTGTVQQLL